jgi:hypothetical protein
MRPIGWQARVDAACSLDSLGESDAAAAQRDAARTIIDAIAADFSDNDLSAAFRGHVAAELGT